MPLESSDDESESVISISANDSSNSNIVDEKEDLVKEVVEAEEKVFMKKYEEIKDEVKAEDMFTDFKFKKHQYIAKGSFVLD